MQFWLGVTNPDWFAFHAQRGSPEVNFWQPGERPAFKHAPDGMPFFFKLKKPYNVIAGGGRWVSTQTFPLGVAWELFGEANGARSLGEFARLIAVDTSPATLQRPITCQILTDVFYLPPDLRLPQPETFAGNIVVGKTYRAHDPDAAALYAALMAAAGAAAPARLLASDGPPLPKWGEERLVKPRLHQGGFRARLFEAYGRRCALTGESTLPTLDAAHIVPYAEADGTHDVTNGMLMRTDFHRLFDLGLVTVEPQATISASPYRIRISPRIAEQWFNGKAYYRLDGQPLAALPARSEWRPDPDRLRWHNQVRFQGA